MKILVNKILKIKIKLKKKKTLKRKFNKISLNCLTKTLLKSS